MKSIIHFIMLLSFVLVIVCLGSSTAIAQASLIDEKFDGVTAPNFPAGWTVDVPEIGGLWTWQTTAGTYNPATPGPPSTPNVATFQSYNLPNGLTARLITPTLNWSAVTTPAFTFKWRRAVNYLSSIDKVFIDASIDGGTTWTQISGPYERPTDVPFTTYWQDISVASSALTPYTGQSSVKFAFRGVSAYGNWIHMDNVFIGQVTANDMGVVSISTPTAGNIFKVPQTVSGSLKNFGTNNRLAGSYNVSVKIWKTSDYPGGTPEFEQVESGPAVTSGSTVAFSFAIQWTPVNYVEYTIKVATELSGDENPANDAAPLRSVTVVPSTDLAVTQIVFPATTGLYTGTLGYGVKGKIKNNGSSTALGSEYTVEAWIGLTDGFPGNATYNSMAVSKPNISAGASADVNLFDSWVPTTPGIYTVRIKVTLAGDEVSSNNTRDESRNVYTVHYGGPDAGGYYFVTNGYTGTPKPAYNWLDITSLGTPLNLGDDGNSAAITIPSFTFYGNTYTSLKVNNNGLIRLDATEPDANYYSNVEIPNPAVPNFFLAPFWDDLAPGNTTGGNVYYYNDVVNSQFIIEYFQISRYGESGNPINTFEVVLNYATNSIFFQYNNMLGNKSASTIGIEGNGTVGIQWLKDGNPTPAMDALVNGRVIYFGTDQNNIPAIQNVGTYALNLNIVGNGTVIKDPNQDDFFPGTPVQLTANPSLGWSFAGWSGDFISTDNPASIVMNSPKNITATFTINTFTIAATAGTNGSIDPSGDVIVDYGFDKSFTITPNTGYHVDGVTVDGNPVDSTTSYTFYNVTGNHSINATFAINKYSLDVTKVGNGSVTKDPDQTTYDRGTSVQLTATPAEGWTFTGWTGSVTSTDNPVTVIMDSDKNITATFTINAYTLDITIVGDGTVTKVPDQPTYNHGTSVQLTATPNVGWTFTGWTGSVTSTDNPLTVIMDGSKNITETFTINTYTLDVTIVGNGTVTKVPDQLTYDHGTLVQLTAAPADLSWKFKEWSGDASGTATALDITMSANKNITATFLRDSNYLMIYRSFLHDSIVALDAKGKVPKAVKKKNIGGYWEFTLTNPLTGAATELHIQFKNDVREVTVYAPFTSVGGDTKKKFDFTGGSVGSGESVKIKGYSKKGKPQQIKKAYFGATSPKPPHAENKPADFEYLELAMPTYANLINEIYADNGFAADGGLLVGTVLSNPKAGGWVLMKKAGDVQKSLRDKTGIHTGGPSFFVEFKNTRPFIKEQKTLPPNKHDNKLFAEIVALKLAIAASVTEYTPLGFGELVYYDTSSAYAAFNGKMVKEIAAEASAAMTTKDSTWGNANSFFTVIQNINEAFDGPIDTANFSTMTVFKGTKALIDVPYLRANPSGLKEKITSTNRIYADVPDIFELGQNYPNPFNPTTNIQFLLPEDAIVTLKVYNILGQEVATLANRELFTEGMNDVEFDASRLSSGVYFYQITVDGVGENVGKFSQVKKMVLMK